jgi:group I intron endonuclease
MFYTIYKITNIINGKTYIGKHQTKNLNDGYMGSGKILRQAISKNGLENFTKEILHVFDNEKEMNDKERELVTIDESTYNLCDGGHGGFGYINRSDIVKFKGKKHTEEAKKKMAHWGNSHGKGSKRSEEAKKKTSEGVSKALKGVPKSDEHKRKIAESVKTRWAERNAGVV